MPTVVEFDTIAQLFQRLCARYAGQGRAALAYKDKRTKAWTDIPWEDFQMQVEAMAAYLHSQGVRPGDRVAILSENRPEWAVVDMATQLLGAVNVSLYTTLPASQVGYIIKDSGTKVFVVSTGLQLRKAEAIFAECPDLQQILTMSERRKDHPASIVGYEDALAAGATYRAAHTDALQALADAVTPDDLSALIYTSGTTGYPKGVMLTHRNFVSNVKAAHLRITITDDDHHLSFLPLSHAFERTAGYLAILAGGAKITYAESIDAVNKNLPEVRPTVMVSVPRLFERVYNLIQKSVEEGGPTKQRIFAWAVATGRKAAAKRLIGRPLGPVLAAEHALAHRLVFQTLHEKLGNNLRFAVSGGAALPRAIGEFFQAAGLTLIEGYGLTETAPVLSVSPLAAPVYGTVGHVLPGVTIAIQDIASGQLIGQVRGEDYPTTLNTAEGEILARGPNLMKGYWGNEQATRDVIDADGWFHTGDIGRFENGHLKITDRLKHMLVSKGGKNIYPGPIEETFKTQPLIDQVMVVGEGREYLTALVVPNYDTLKSLAAAESLPFTELKDLLALPRVTAAYEDLFKAYSKEAASHEKIRDFRFVSEPFSVENNLMTPTLKLRRRAIEEQYRDLVETMYEEVV